MLIHLIKHNSLCFIFLVFRQKNNYIYSTRIYIYKAYVCICIKQRHRDCELEREQDGLYEMG